MSYGIYGNGAFTVNPPFGEEERAALRSWSWSARGGKGVPRLQRASGLPEGSPDHPHDLLVSDDGALIEPRGGPLHSNIGDWLRFVVEWGHQRGHLLEGEIELLGEEPGDVTIMLAGSGEVRELGLRTFRDDELEKARDALAQARGAVRSAFDELAALGETASENITSARLGLQEALSHLGDLVIELDR